jgi:ABC-2 type transport system permease protein
MRVILALIGKEWRVLARDRHGLAVLFIMPAVFILIMSLALRDAMDPDRATLEYLWLDQDGSYFAQEINTALTEKDNLVRVTGPADEAALLERLRAGDAPFGVRIAAGLSDRIAAASTSPSSLAQIYVSPTAPVYARLLFIAQVRAALAQVQIEYLIEDEMGMPHEDAQKLRAQTSPALIPVDEIVVGQHDAGLVAPDAVQQAVPAWIVFAMFFVVLPIATSVITERADGNLQRLALLNVSPGRLLSAKFPAYYVINMIQVVVMLAVGAFVVPKVGGDALVIDGSLAGLWIVTSAVSLAAIGFAVLIAVIAQSVVHATTIGGVSNLILGAVGGVMVPKMVMPPVMQTASMISPMSWALEGCWDILLRGGGPVDVLPEAAALAVFGILAFAAATALYPRSAA